MALLNELCDLVRSSNHSESTDIFWAQKLLIYQYQDTWAQRLC